MNVVPTRSDWKTRAWPWAAVFLLSACAAPIEKLTESITPAQGPAPVMAVTQMEDALRCLSQRYPAQADLRLGVNDLTDGTGATLSSDNLSKVLTQRPDMMMTIALAKTGARVVNRSSTGVAEWELRQAMQKYIGDGNARLNPANKESIPYRPIMAGSVLGSTHYVSGAITELNWNLQSDVSEYGIGGLTWGSRGFRISIAIDLMVTNTLSTEIVFARSYTKQLVGREMSAGLFRFFDVGRQGRNWGGKEVFEFNLGRQANEPVQTAVRWMIETAAYEIVSNLSGVGSSCDTLLPEGSQPLRVKAPEAIVQAAPTTPMPTVAPAATAVATPSSTAQVNAIEGVNLFEDGDDIILRVDTRQPLTAPPTLQTNTTNAVAFIFDRVGNAVGTPGALQSASIKGIALTEYQGNTRLAVDLNHPLGYSLERNGHSLLIVFRRLGQASAVTLPSGEPGTPGSGTANNSKVTGSVEGADLLAPTKAPDGPTALELFQQTRKR